MAQAQIMLIIGFILLFWLTRIVWVRIIKEDRLVIELHLPLLAVSLSIKKEKNKKKNKKLSAFGYFRIIIKTISHIKRCKVEVRRIGLPIKDTAFGSLSLVKPFGYQGVIYTLLAYLKTEADKLILFDNAVISSPDIRELQFHITFKLRLFQLIYALTTIKRGIDKEKRARG